uniref:Uncharacterized protein n=1 Tax=Fagus sylvatica TaxID=28930 RepID=A0A2N9I498_FAGSY
MQLSLSLSFSHLSFSLLLGSHGRAGPSHERQAQAVTPSPSSCGSFLLAAWERPMWWAVVTGW